MDSVLPAMDQSVDFIEIDTNKESSKHKNRCNELILQSAKLFNEKKSLYISDQNSISIYLNIVNKYLHHYKQIALKNI
jgi:hypothetical protein